MPTRVSDLIEVQDLTGNEDILVLAANNDLNRIKSNRFRGRGITVSAVAPTEVHADALMTYGDGDIYIHTNPPIQSMFFWDQSQAAGSRWVAKGNLSGTAFHTAVSLADNQFETALGLTLALAMGQGDFYIHADLQRMYGPNVIGTGINFDPEDTDNWATLRGPIRIRLGVQADNWTPADIVDRLSPEYSPQVGDTLWVETNDGEHGGYVYSWDQGLFDAANGYAAQLIAGWDAPNRAFYRDPRLFLEPAAPTQDDDKYITGDVFFNITTGAQYRNYTTGVAVVENDGVTPRAAADILLDTWGVPRTTTPSKIVTITNLAPLNVYQPARDNNAYGNGDFIIVDHSNTPIMYGPYVPAGNTDIAALPFLSIMRGSHTTVVDTVLNRLPPATTLETITGDNANVENYTVRVVDGDFFYVRIIDATGQYTGTEFTYGPAVVDEALGTIAWGNAVTTRKAVTYTKQVTSTTPEDALPNVLATHADFGGVRPQVGDKWIQLFSNTKQYSAQVTSINIDVVTWSTLDPHTHAVFGTHTGVVHPIRNDLTTYTGEILRGDTYEYGPYVSGQATDLLAWPHAKVIRGPLVHELAVTEAVFIRTNLTHPMFDPIRAVVDIVTGDSVVLTITDSTTGKEKLYKNAVVGNDLVTVAWDAPVRNPGTNTVFTFVGNGHPIRRDASYFAGDFIESDLGVRYGPYVSAQATGLLAWPFYSYQSPQQTFGGTTVPTNNRSTFGAGRPKTGDAYLRRIAGTNTGKEELYPSVVVDEALAFNATNLNWGVAVNPEHDRVIELAVNQVPVLDADDYWTGDTVITTIQGIMWRYGPYDSTQATSQLAWDYAGRIRMSASSVFVSSTEGDFPVRDPQYANGDYYQLTIQSGTWWYGPYLEGQTSDALAWRYASVLNKRPDQFYSTATHTVHPPRNDVDYADGAYISLPTGLQFGPYVRNQANDKLAWPVYKLGDVNIHNVVLVDAVTDPNLGPANFALPLKDGDTIIGTINGSTKRVAWTLVTATIGDDFAPLGGFNLGNRRNPDAPKTFFDQTLLQPVGDDDLYATGDVLVTKARAYHGPYVEGQVTDLLSWPIFIPVPLLPVLTDSTTGLQYTLNVADGNFFLEEQA